ncbi:MAG: reactive intermediate/imine deaminase [Candidatus Nephrothrix sp. EaCA]|nr:MAG: reactive intermediate/imine deaminase [Candidatus Nephrothrix sp. EaCA]
MTKEIINSDQAPEPIGPYSQAVKANQFLFVSGQVAIDRSTGKLHTENIAAETAQVMQNLETILKAAGLDFSKAVKCTIFLKNMGQFAAVNEVYGKYFDAQPPARETVEVAALPRGVNVEISCIAAY